MRDVARVLAVLALGSSAACAAPPPVRGERAVFEVTPQVQVPAVPRLAVNVEPYLYRPWSPAPLQNAWNTWGNPEPMDLRVKGTASGGGPDYLEDRFERGRRPGLSYWDSFRSGFFDGATVHVYRFTNGVCRRLRVATVARSEMGGPALPGRLTFTETGPAPQAGDEYLLVTRKTSLPPGQIRQFEGRSPFTQLSFGERPQAGATVELDAATAAPEGGSTASLKASFPGGPAQLTQPWLGTERRWVCRLKPGAPYRLSVWLKQAGMPTGQVRLAAGSLAQCSVQVTGEWQRFTLDLTGREPQQPSEALSIGSAEAGTLWVDNLLVAEPGLPPFAFDPTHVARLRAARPSYLRVWPLQVNEGWGTSLDAGLNPPFAAPLRLDERRAEAATAVNLHGLLQLCADVGADPWIITSTQYTLEEQAALIEYLAGPADSPYGARRAALGRREPWTSAFGRILIEAGNETWNPMFRPQGFAGRPRDYGAYAELMFGAMKASPFWQPAKFGLVLNGWTAQTDDRGYGMQAAGVCPSADLVDLAPYLGGWDVGGALATGDDADSLFNRLMTHQRMYAALMAEAAQAAARLSQARGRPLRLAIYESGPGYSLPRPDRGPDPAEQATGKSLGLAIAWFDQMLADQALGFGPQAFFLYQPGDFWSSHTPDWRPHATWLGQRLLDTWATGDLLAVRTVETPTVDLPATVLSRQADGGGLRRERPLAAQANVPLVQAYAYRDGTRLAVALLSRRLAGTTPVQVTLPAGATEATVHLLTGPTAAANNLAGDAVALRDEPLRPDGRELRWDLPPHTLAVLVATVGR